MSQMKASDFDPRVLKLFDGYVHSIISRRSFLDRAAAYTVGGVTAAIPATQIVRGGFLVTSIGPRPPRTSSPRASGAAPSSESMDTT